MDNQAITTWIGKLSFDLLFKDSKSEGFYPVLHCEDGISYRVYLKGTDILPKELLNSFVDQRISLLGRADNLRGHWRLVVDSNDLNHLVKLASNQLETSSSQIKNLGVDGE